MTPCIQRCSTPVLTTCYRNLTLVHLDQPRAKLGLLPVISLRVTAPVSTVLGGDFLYVVFHNLIGLKRKLLSLSKAVANKRPKYFWGPLLLFSQ